MAEKWEGLGIFIRFCIFTWFCGHLCKFWCFFLSGLLRDYL